MKMKLPIAWTAAVTASVLAAAQPGLAANDAASTRPGTAVVIDVLENDGLPEEARVTEVKPAERGEVVTGDGGKLVIYTPEDGFQGEDRFVYTTGGSAEAPVTGIVTVSVTSATAQEARKSAQLEETGRILLLLLVLAILLESGLSVLFNWRPFVVLGESRGLKTPIAIVTAAVFVFSYDINAVEDVLEAFAQEDLEDSWPGRLITAFIVAGGSGLIFQMFEKFGLRNPLARRRESQEARERSRLKILVARKAVPATQPILIKVDDKIIGSIDPDETSFGGVLGHAIDAGVRKFELSGVDEQGKAVSTPARSETLAPGATVSLSFEI